MVRRSVPAGAAAAAAAPALLLLLLLLLLVVVVVSPADSATAAFACQGTSVVRNRRSSNRRILGLSTRPASRCDRRPPATSRSGTLAPRRAVPWAGAPQRDTERPHRPSPGAAAAYSEAGRPLQRQPRDRVAAALVDVDDDDDLDDAEPSVSFVPWMGSGSILVPTLVPDAAAAAGTRAAAGVPLAATPPLWEPLLAARLPRRGGGGAASGGSLGLSLGLGLSPSPNRVDYRVRWTVPSLDRQRRRRQRQRGGSSAALRRESLRRLQGVILGGDGCDLGADRAGNGRPPPFSEAQVRELAALMFAFEAWIRRCSAVAGGGSGRGPSDVRVRLRLVAARGPKAASKCPRWHADHVPFRWVQSLAGPGCDVVVDPAAVHWDVLAGCGADDDEVGEPATALEWNRRVVRNDVPGAIRHVPPGQPVVLLGGRWREWTLRFGTASSPSVSPTALPVVHKSPALRLPWQGRVLLTMDVECENLL